MLKHLKSLRLLPGRFSWIFFFSLPLFVPLMSAQTSIVAHRGFSSIAPENTLIAFEKAIECGADYFELDVQRSKDGSPMVIHDDTVDRTASDGSTGEVAALNDRALSAIHVGFSTQFGTAFSDEKVPTLREALELAKGRIGVCIEIKAPHVEAAVMQLVEELDMVDDVIVFSFDADILREIRKINSRVRTLFLKSDADPSTFEMASELQAQAIGVGGKTEITASFLEQARLSGLELWQWTVNDPQEMKRLIDLQIDGLITNHPDQALRFITE